MNEAKIRINGIDEVNRFVNILDKFSCSFDLVNGGTLVDAKSPVGVISMAVGKTVTLQANCTEEQMKEVVEQLSDFIVP